jgi:hypothetical protein
MECAPSTRKVALVAHRKYNTVRARTRARITVVTFASATSATGGQNGI